MICMCTLFPCSSLFFFEPVSKMTAVLAVSRTDEGFAHKRVFCYSGAQTTDHTTHVHQHNLRSLLVGSVIFHPRTGSEPAAPGCERERERGRELAGLWRCWRETPMVSLFLVKSSFESQGDTFCSTPYRCCVQQEADTVRRMNESKRRARCVIFSGNITGQGSNSRQQCNGGGERSTAVLAPHGGGGTPRRFCGR